MSTVLEASCHLVYLGGLPATDVTHVYPSLQLAQAAVTSRMAWGTLHAEGLPAQAAASRALYCLSKQI